MALELDLAQTVAIGSFNPAIITPDWLHEVGVCTPGTKDASAYPDWPDGTAFIAGGCGWEVEYPQLTITVVDREADSGLVLANVLKNLPHTPVEAVGHNFHYTCLARDWNQNITPVLGKRAIGGFQSGLKGQSALKHLRAEEVRWDGRFSKDDGWVEVTLRYTVQADDYAVVLFNHHHIVTGESVKERSGQAQTAAQKYSEDCRLTVELLNYLFEIDEVCQ